MTNITLAKVTEKGNADCMIGFNPHPRQVVVLLDMALYDDYLCLVASNKQQIQWAKIRRNPQERRIIGNS